MKIGEMKIKTQERRHGSWCICSSAEAVKGKMILEKETGYYFLLIEMSCGELGGGTVPLWQLKDLQTNSQGASLLQL